MSYHQDGIGGHIKAVLVVNLNFKANRAQHGADIIIALVNLLLFCNFNDQLDMHVDDEKMVMLDQVVLVCQYEVFQAY